MERPESFLKEQTFSIGSVLCVSGGYNPKIWSKFAQLQHKCSGLKFDRFNYQIIQQNLTLNLRQTKQKTNKFIFRNYSDNFIHGKKVVDLVKDLIINIKMIHLFRVTTIWFKKIWHSGIGKYRLIIERCLCHTGYLKST